jgi:hypothetical protein
MCFRIFLCVAPHRPEDDEDENEDEDVDGWDDEKEEKFNYEDDSEESGEENQAKWKENMKLNAQMNFEKNKVTNWSNLVYGKENQNMHEEKALKKLDSDDDDNDFFKVRPSY